MEKIGCFSVERKDGGGYDVRDDNSSLRVLKSELQDPTITYSVEYDLNEGYVHLEDGGSLVGARVGDARAMEFMLHWIRTNKQTLETQFGAEPILAADFITTRGILTKVMNAPYERFKGWTIGVTKHKGVIYMNDLFTEEDDARYSDLTDDKNQEYYRGFRFDRYVTDAFYPGVDKKIQGRNDGFYCVVKSNLDGHRIAFQSQIDCINDRASDLKLDDFVEIKYTQSVGTDYWKQQKFHQFRLCKWWMQSYITGVPEVLCGFRDEDDVVRKVEHIPVSSMPEMGRGFWSTDLLINSLAEFLHHIKQVVTEDDPSVVYKFRWSPPFPTFRLRTNDRWIDDMTHCPANVTHKDFVVPQSYVDGL